MLLVFVTRIQYSYTSVFDHITNMCWCALHEMPKCEVLVCALPKKMALVNCDEAMVLGSMHYVMLLQTPWSWTIAL